MALDPTDELFDALAQLGVLALCAAELHERAHDQDVHGDSSSAPQDAREHGNAFLCERSGRGPTASAMQAT